MHCKRGNCLPKFSNVEQRTLINGLTYWLILEPYCHYFFKFRATNLTNV